MKHGVAFRKFSRPTAHRMLMLRNLVTSLIHHEQIKTTLPKAKDAARLADKLITLGKKGDLPAFRKATGFLLDQNLVPKVFGDLAKRYADRPGGYTRVHKYGNRPGDNAPHAILELVDNPGDIRFQLTARAVGLDLASKRVMENGIDATASTGLTKVESILDREKEIEHSSGLRGELRPITRRNLQKVLKYREPEATREMSAIATDHADTLLAQPTLVQKLASERFGGRQFAHSHLDRGSRFHRWGARPKLGVDATTV
ncbi:mitochondrial ribosomal protein L17 [Epithele typhae]|uniref:mitochondrial ribosomal protein L17 n=1 Tax=Epithele typhae TaxID=378194 RepID=UPI0020086CE6|nr:mitochondrial ribosomal protein L17 [Epithele typhae]KAH9944056.1 mitochondrial ribosomal protein L17 [Epithele typhae]